MFCSRALLLLPAAAAAFDTGMVPPSSRDEDADTMPPTPVYLKPASSAHRKPSFFFPRMRDTQYPSFAFKPSTLGSALPLFSITSPSCEYYALRLPLLKAGFRRLHDDDVTTASNLIWGRSMPFREMLRSSDVGSGSATSYLRPPFVSNPNQDLYHRRLTMVNPFQRFNHFPLSHGNLGCKKGMAVNVRRAMEKAETAATTDGEKEAVRDRYRFMPRTWLYPEEKDALVVSMKAVPRGVHFIWKPARGSCGRGIIISEGGADNSAAWEKVMREIDHKAACPETGRLFRNHVVQEYIEDPFLVEGRKMDLRLYVGVTSMNPLTVYWHEEGLVRLAAEAYADDSGASGNEDIRSTRTRTHERFRHLTNYSVGRKYAALQEAQAAAAAAAGSLNSLGQDGDVTPIEGPELKWPLQRLWDYIDARSGHVRQDSSSLLSSPRPSDKVREQIAQLITRTLMSVRPMIDSAIQQMPASGSYFELFGFDVMLDAGLNPYLIEVNTLPSLESSSTFDYATKTNVVSDLLNVAMLEPFERKVLPGSALSNAKAFGDDPQCSQGKADPSLAHPVASGMSDLVRAGVALRPGAHSREEVRLRLTDELGYARGFQRIFPAKPATSPLSVKEELHDGRVVSTFTPISHPEHSLASLGGSAAYRDDIRAYTRNKVLTQSDIWAQET